MYTRQWLPWAPKPVSHSIRLLECLVAHHTNLCHRLIIAKHDMCEMQTEMP